MSPQTYIQNLWRCGQKNSWKWQKSRVNFSEYSKFFIFSENSYLGYANSVKFNFFQFVGQNIFRKAIFSRKNVDFGAVVMATRFFIETFLDCDTVLADDTFKTEPQPFSQVYKIFGFLTFFGFAILSNKFKESYKSLLSVHQFFFDWLQKKRYTAAARKFFHEAQHLGCQFGYCQSVFKKNVHLATEYRQKKTRETFQRLFTLPYLPIGLVRTNYTRIDYDWKNLILSGISDGISIFFGYFEKTWLNAQYPLKTCEKD